MVNGQWSMVILSTERFIPKNLINYKPVRIQIKIVTFIIRPSKGPNSFNFDLETEFQKAMRLINGSLSLTGAQKGSLELTGNQ